MGIGIRPLGSRVMVLPDEKDGVSRGGIIIPDAAKKKPVWGTVVAVGPGKKTDSGTNVALDVTVGDRVVFSKYGGTEINIDGDECLLLDEESIYAVKDH